MFLNKYGQRSVSYYDTVGGSIGTSTTNTVLNMFDAYLSDAEPHDSDLDYMFENGFPYDINDSVFDTDKELLYRTATNHRVYTYGMSHTVSYSYDFTQIYHMGNTFILTDMTSIPTVELFYDKGVCKCILPFFNTP